VPVQRSANLYLGLTTAGNSGLVRGIGAFLILLVVVSILTSQFWLVPIGLLLVGGGLLLTSR